MAERSIAAVLKTVEVQASGGSNPSLSATHHIDLNGFCDFLKLRFTSFRSLRQSANLQTFCKHRPQKPAASCSWSVQQRQIGHPASPPLLLHSRHEVTIGVEGERHTRMTKALADNLGVLACL